MADRRRPWWTVISLAGLLLIAASCGGGGSDGAEESGADEPADEPADEGGVDDTVAGEPADEPADEAGDGTTEPPAEPVDVTLPPEEDESAPVAGGTLRFGLEADVDGLNPTSSSLSAPGMVMASTVFDTLATVGADGEVVPFLAESWSSNDALTEWDITVRQGITFHDGTALNADALIANFEAQRNDELVGLAVRPFFPAEGAVEKIDEFTVRFKPLEPHASFPSYLTTQLGLVASPTWLAAAEADPTLNQRPVGTGPFLFESRSEDSVTRVVRNDDWWNGEVYLDAVEFYPISDPADRVDQLFAGVIDGLHTTDPAAILDLGADESIQQILNDEGEEGFLMMNSTGAPVDDIRVRQALAAATPREEYLTLIGLDLLRPADQRHTPESPYYNPAVVQVVDQPDRAVELAAEYCAERGDEVNPDTGQPNCTDGRINIVYTYQGGAVVAERLAELLDRGWSVAFNTTFDPVNQQDLIARAAIGQYDVMAWRQFGAGNPALDNVWVFCRTIDFISINWPRYCDEERDALLLQGQATTDDAERIELYQQVEEMINAAYTYVFLNHTLWDTAFAPNVRGACNRVSPDGTPLACVGNGTVWLSSIWLE